jgi:hypothetical protein
MVTVLLASQIVLENPKIGTVLVDGGTPVRAGNVPASLHVSYDGSRHAVGQFRPPNLCQKITISSRPIGELFLHAGAATDGVKKRKNTP